MNYIVYILKVIGTDDVRYVGITTEKLQTRLVKHYHDINRESCKNLHKKHWLAKHKGSIVIQEIDRVDSWEELTQKEIFYIAKYRAEGAKLLNVTDGGDGPLGFKHREDSLTKRRGKDHPSFGTVNTIMAEKYGVKVEALIDGEWKLFLSIKQLEKVFKTKSSLIREICEGIYPKNRDRKCKHKFRYFGKEYIERETIKIKEKRPLNNKSIEGLINNIWIKFDSASVAANILNIQRTKIICVCKGSRKHTAGYKFRYINTSIVNNNNLILL